MALLCFDTLAVNFYVKNEIPLYSFVQIQFYRSDPNGVILFSIYIKADMFLL
jgi:hypothetical protein